MQETHFPASPATRPRLRAPPTPEAPSPRPRRRWCPGGKGRALIPQCWLRRVPRASGTARGTHPPQTHSVPELGLQASW